MSRRISHFIGTALALGLLQAVEKQGKDQEEYLAIKALTTFFARCKFEVDEDLIIYYDEPMPVRQVCQNTLMLGFQKEIKERSKMLAPFPKMRNNKTYIPAHKKLR